MNILCLACALAVLAGGTTAQTSQADPVNLQTEYIVSTWSQADGLPSGYVRALAQDTDGYIWVGTDTGLYRFDGVHFVAVRIDRVSDHPAGAQQVRVLFASSSGGVWVALGSGKILRYSGGATEYLDDLPNQIGMSVSALVEDSHGVLWVGSAAGLFKHVPDTLPVWLPTDVRVSVVDARIDRSGRLLVVTPGGLLRGESGNARFERLTGGSQDIREVAEAPDGRLYASDSLVGFRPLGESVSRLSAGPTRGRHLVIDRQGNLWVGTGGQGLWRWTRDRSTDRFSAASITATTGLPSGGVVALMEDRQGNIWAGTLAGLTRLTRRKVQLIPNLFVVAGAEQTPDDSLWIGTSGEVLRFAGDSTTAPSERWPTGSQVRALHADPQGTVWVATDQYLAQLANGRLTRLPTSGEFPRRIDNLTSLPGNTLIVYDLDRGFLRWQSGRFQQVSLPATVQNQPVVASYTDRTSRVWLAFGEGQLATLSRYGQVVVHDENASASGGHYDAIVEDDDGRIWFAGSRGLTRYAKGHFANLDQSLFPAALTSIVLDTAGNSWIGSSVGISRVERAELDKAFIDSGYRPKLVTYDRFDGLSGMPVSYSRNRRAIRRRDGKLWFLTGQGITILDPATIATSQSTAKVYVESMTADGRSVDFRQDIALPPRTQRVDFEFSALNVTSGSKIRFRYKLDSFDPAWIVAGTRTQASYTNLLPGNYRFRVSATDGDGRWTDTERPWEFSVRPAFYQTVWFTTILLLTVSAALWGGWRLHTRRVRREFSLLLRERTRVSREIHDRLLQNLVALTLEFDEAACKDELPRHNGQLVRWRKLVEQYIAEARQAIWNLRSPAPEEKGFIALLKQNCERSSGGRGADYLKFSVTGEPRDCSANAEEQVLRIAQEAVHNASRHALAKTVTVQLSFEDRHLSLTVSDDGTGFEPASQTQHNGDHFGLRMMRERAENMGGVFDIISALGKGTTVSVRVPAPPPKSS